MPARLDDAREFGERCAPVGRIAQRITGGNAIDRSRRERQCADVATASPMCRPRALASASILVDTSVAATRTSGRRAASANARSPVPVAMSATTPLRGMAAAATSITFAFQPWSIPNEKTRVKSS
jgi:hypothetical protein